MTLGDYDEQVLPPIRRPAAKSTVSSPLQISDLMPSSMRLSESSGQAASSFKSRSSSSKSSISQSSDSQSAADAESELSHPWQKKKIDAL